jgi:hypothetical protein
MPLAIRRAITLALCAGAVAALLAGCSLGTPPETGTTTTTQDKMLLLGRWMDSAHGIGYEFLAQNEMVGIIKDEERPGTYRVTGNQVTMFADEVVLEAAWKVNAATLTLTIEGLPAATFKRE